MYALKFCLLLAVLRVSYSVTLAYSSPSTTTITWPSVRSAGACGYDWGSSISQVPQAVWVWDGNGLQYGCFMNLRVAHDLYIKCLNQPLTVYMMCDNSFSFQLNGGTGASGGWGSPFVYTISTTNVTCGTKLTLNINATNAGTDSCNTNPAGLMYAVTSNDCACSSGYIYDSSVCGCSLCTKFLSNCATCSSASVCSSCSTSSYTVVSGTCRACSSLISNCLTCSSSSTCTSCSSGFFVSGGSCVGCSANCVTCTSPTSCTTCASGYAPNNGACQTCPSLIVGCTLCSSKTVCTACNSAANFQLNGSTCSCTSGYTLSNSQCVTCGSLMSNCVTCTSTTSCIACTTGYAPNNGVCQTCPSLIVGCTLCSSNLLCTSCNTGANFVSAYPGCGCASGYALSGTTCQTCSTTLTGCTTCSSTTVCTGCGSGYVLNTTTCATCMSFIPGCLLCSSKTVCTACNSTANFYLSGITCSCTSGFALSNSQCATCSSLIGNCVTCSSSSVCTSCSSGYAVSNGTCKTCITFLTACLTCTSTLACTSCSNNNYILVNSQCKTCGSMIPGCLNCSSATVCTVCDTASNFILSGSTCACANGYALSGTSCQFCNVTLTACGTCTSTTSCTSCNIDGYALSVSVCSLCSSLINGCVKCSSPTVCTTCNSTALFQLVGNVCKCNNGYTEYGNGACISCSTFLTACTACTSTSVCTSCTNSHALNNSICKTCSTFMVGCLTCTSTVSCSTCDASVFFELNATNKCSCMSGYALNGTVCRTCDSLITGCTVCPSKSICTQCRTADNFVLSNSTCACNVGYALTGTACQTCSSLMSGCLTCSSRSVCTSCDTRSNFLLSSSLCLCQDNFYFNGTGCPSCDPACVNCRGTATNCTSCVKGKYLQNGNCLTCAVGCLDCTLSTQCNSCGRGFTLVNGICSCNTGTYLNNATNTCDSCNETCYSCNGPLSSNCLACVELQFRLFSNGTCGCNTTNYKQSASTYPACQIIDTTWCRSVEVWDSKTNQCVEKCGDGKLYTLDCDDGNLIDGDGCSSTCTIEPNYVCRGGTNETRSICSYNQSLQLSLTSTIKQPKANTLTLTLKVEPPLDAISGLSNLKNMIQTNIPTNGLTVTYQKGQLTIKINYTDNVQGKVAQVSLAAPGDTSSMFAVQGSSVEFTVIPDNNQPANYYPSEVYQTKQITDKAAEIGQTVALSSFTLGVVVAKSLSLELTNVLQMSYYGLSTVDSPNPVQSSLYNLKYMSGYNKMLSNLNITFFDTEKTSRRLLQATTQQSSNIRLKALGYQSAHLIANFNYMYAAIFGIIIIFLFVYWAAKATDKETLKKIAAFFLKDIVFMLLFFSVNNMGFSMGLQFKYLMFGQNWTTPLYVSWALAIFSLVILIVYITYYIKNSIQFGDFSEKFKDDKLSQCHYPIMLIGRYLLNVVCGYFNEHPQLNYAIAAFEVVFLLYLIVKRPYKQLFFNVVGILNETAVLGVVSINMYYRIFAPNNNDGTFVALPAWIQMGLLGLCVILNYIAIMVYIYQKCCRKNVIYPRQSEDKEQQVKINTKMKAIPLNSSKELNDHPLDESVQNIGNNAEQRHQRYNIHQVSTPDVSLHDSYDPRAQGGFMQQVENIQIGVGKKRHKRFRVMREQ